MLKYDHGTSSIPLSPITLKAGPCIPVFLFGRAPSGPSPPTPQQIPPGGIPTTAPFYLPAPLFTFLGGIFFPPAHPNNKRQKGGSLRSPHPLHTSGPTNSHPSPPTQSDSRRPLVLGPWGLFYFWAGTFFLPGGFLYPPAPLPPRRAPDFGPWDPKNVVLGPHSQKGPVEAREGRGRYILPSELFAGLRGPKKRVLRGLSGQGPPSHAGGGYFLGVVGVVLFF